MKIKAIISISLIVAVATIGSAQSPRRDSPAPKSGLGQFSWIVGTWEVTGNLKKAVEKWTRDSTGGYSGVGLVIQGKDTTVTQRSTIAKNGDKIVFSTEFVLRKQKSSFVFSGIDSSEYHFENPDASQYPKTVSYQPIGSDSLSAWVGGPSGGGAFQRQGYKFRRSR